jgi:hypothetical protein
MGGLERGERNLTLRSVERIAASIGVEALALMRNEVKARHGIREAGRRGAS